MVECQGRANAGILPADALCSSGVAGAAPAAQIRSWAITRTRSVCLAWITMGGFTTFHRLSSTAIPENTMTKIHKAVLPVALLVSALALSACATKPREAVAEPAPAPVAAAQATTEPVSAPAAVAEQPAPAPVVVAEQPAPKPAVKKARKKAHKAKVAPPKEVEPQPVAAPEPAPVVQQETPAAAQPEPVPPAVAAQPVQKAAPGFLEKYWLWLLGIIIAVLAFVWMTKKD